MGRSGYECCRVYPALNSVHPAQQAQPSERFLPSFPQPSPLLSTMPSIAPPILDPLDPLLLESHPGLLRVERYKTMDERFLVVDADFTVGETLCLIQGWTRCGHALRLL